MKENAKAKLDELEDVLIELNEIGEHVSDTKDTSYSVTKRVVDLNFRRIILLCEITLIGKSCGHEDCQIDAYGFAAITIRESAQKIAALCAGTLARKLTEEMKTSQDEETKH